MPYKKQGLLIACIALTLTNTQAQNTNIVVELDPIEVNPTSSIYTTEEISSATLTPTPLIELPQTVEVIPQSIIEQTGSSDLYEALKYVAGVSTGGDSPNTRTSGQFRMRGVSGSGATLNGSLMANPMSYFLDSANIERIEVYKGPIGSIEGSQTTTLGPYGSGGSINVVTKKALPFYFSNVDLSTKFGDNLENYRGTIDLNTPITKDGSLSLRINGAVEYDSPEWLPSSYDMGESYFLAPALSWTGDDFSLNLDTSFQYSDSPAYMGFPVFHGNVGEYSDVYYGNNDTREKYFGSSIQLSGTKDITDNWKLRGGASWTHVDIEQNYWAMQTSGNKGMTLAETYDSWYDAGIAPISYSYSDKSANNYEVYGNTLVMFDTGNVKHGVVVGMDYGVYKTDTDSSGGRGGSSTTLDVDLANPDIPDNPDYTTTNSKSELRRFGILAQEQFEWNQLRGIVGARMDNHESDDGNKATSVSPKAALTYMFTEKLAGYGSFSMMEGPNFGYDDANGDELTSSWESMQGETGVKMDILENLSVNAAYYYIQMQNMPTYNTDTDGYETDASGHYQGVEFSLIGQITRSWNMFASYVYTQYTNDDTDEQVDSFPENSIAIWQTYEFQESCLKDLTLGLGYRYNDGYDNTFRGVVVGEGYQVPSYDVFDVFAQYPIKMKDSTAIVKIAVNNIFDEDYVESTRHTTQAFPGDPLNVELSLTMEF